MSNPTYLVLAFYSFVDINNPHALIQAHKLFFEGKDIASRIYISEAGINGQMSGIQSDAEAYMAWMQDNPLFANMPFKIHFYHQNVFPRQTVKYRKQLVALDEEVSLINAGTHLSPKEWKEMLEKNKDTLVIDVRNSYESDVGHFVGAERPPCDTFREFRAYADTLLEKVNPSETTIMMYCTGGIRCEPFSAFLKAKGFQNVCQLDGGVINYGLKEGSAHWLGKLFVFDDRLTVPISHEETPVIGQCKICAAESESYYNCANMDCNALFLCCPTCLEQLQGCCSSACSCSTRIRPYHHQNPHKPFRKWYHYFPTKNTDQNSPSPNA